LVGLLDARLAFLFQGSWFSAALVAFFLYLALMRRQSADG
jgi:cytosine/uracil/thiamine/allantoin permease